MSKRPVTPGDLLFLRRGNISEKKQKPTLLWISSNNWSWAVAKGNASTYNDQFEGGFFGKVITVHPLARETQTITIGPNHDVVEFGFDSLPGGTRWRLLRILYFPIYIIIAALGVRKLILQHNVDIIRASDPYWSGFIGWISARTSAKHFCVSLHSDYDREENLDASTSVFGAKFLSRFVMRSADLVMPISKFLAKSAVSQGVEENSISVIPHGVDTNLFSGEASSRIRQRFGVPENNKIVIYVNRLSRQKYCYDVLEIASIVSRNDVSFLICGDGPERSAMEKIISENSNLRSRVYLLGFQSREVVAELAAEAQVGLVLLAGFGLIEMSLSRLPVIVYDYEWQSEVVEDGETGCVVELGDIQGASLCVERLLENTKLSEEMGERARERAAADYSLLAASNRRIRAYKKLLVT